MDEKQHNTNIQPIHTNEEIEKSRLADIYGNQPVKSSVTPAGFNSDIPEIKKRRKILHIISENIRVILYSAGALLAGYLILLFVIAPIQVSGISMQPTLHTCDYLLTFKLPQTWSQATKTQYIPGRGQVVIVNDPNKNGELYVKRVVALPGENVNVSSGIVTVFNGKNPKGFDPDKAQYGKTLNLYQPGMDYGSSVNPGQIFVMGDNRVPGASIDSRSSLGNIPSKDIVGQVLIRIWPLNKIKLF